MLAGKRILLVVAGGIAAYRALDLIRRLRERGASIRPLLTAAGAQFVTPLSLAALAGDKVYSDLFSLTDESEMGHIRLARDNDLVVVAPATADILAKMASGFASDLATTALLATDKPILVAPSMNVVMWENPATKANVATLLARGVRFVGPGAGNLACGEVGDGRLAEVMDIVAAIEAQFAPKLLAGRSALVTSGPTFEPLDPVRFIGNRSSGRQGHAIAQALADLGATTTLVSGPVAIPDPVGVNVVRVGTAREMLAACEKALPSDVAVMTAAVADWRPEEASSAKIKKRKDAPPPAVKLAENPDILRTIASRGNGRPQLVVGFAAETGNAIEQGRAKLASKGCDWIVANDVSEPGVLGGDENIVHIIDSKGVESWPRLSKTEVAARLARRIAGAFV
ncbi:MAG TPA: bifunctional phosphopantothenoylcysteine decarboxylase/phosphopantothenate--cysteine ligase CoaBC [Alphaproteobacteria bacterium]|nr:bifunctional phosphopantothenoylcysteine decarboxylase/phosphopantothenate--cysteine ligase CoaBC [Alphaproteobacteria bacterium]